MNFELSVNSWVYEKERNLSLAFEHGNRKSPKGF